MQNGFKAFLHEMVQIFLTNFATLISPKISCKNATILVNPQYFYNLLDLKFLIHSFGNPEQTLFNWPRERNELPQQI